MHCYFILFSSLFSLFFIFFYLTLPDADVCHRGGSGGDDDDDDDEETQRERKRGRADRADGEGCSREKSFNVKVTWAHAHRMDHTQKRNGAEAVRSKGRATEERKPDERELREAEGPASLGRMLSSLSLSLSSGDIRCILLPAASGRQKYNANCQCVCCRRGPKTRAAVY